MIDRRGKPFGDYAAYPTREIIPFVDREFRTLAGREHRGCFGKSSGGYGATIHGMKYAKYWGAFNAESGEAIEERWRNWRRHDPSGTRQAQHVIA